MRTKTFPIKTTYLGKPLWCLWNDTTGKALWWDGWPGNTTSTPLFRSVQDALMFREEAVRRNWTSSKPPWRIVPLAEVLGSFDPQDVPGEWMGFWILPENWRAEL